MVDQEQDGSLCFFGQGADSRLNGGAHTLLVIGVIDKRQAGEGRFKLASVSADNYPHSIDSGRFDGGKNPL